MKISIKHFFLFSFILLEMFSAALFAAENPPRVPVSETDFVNKRITLTITIVIARQRDCEGFGICRATLAADRTVLNSAVTSAYLDENLRNMLTFEINKATGLSTDTYRKYFSTGTFLMEDDFTLTDEIARSLGLTGSKVIVAGKYKTIEKNGIIYLTVPFK